MAEEDILYGKNRHLFGGIEPSNMKKFEVRTDSENLSYLDYELPSDTVIDGQVVCTVGGAIIRKKRGWYPENEFDGDLVVDAKCDGSVGLGMIDHDEKYDTYYAAFPYSAQGVYNRSHGNRAYHTIQGKVHKITARYTPSTKRVYAEFTCDRLTEPDSCYIAMLSDDEYATCETFKDSSAMYFAGSGTLCGDHFGVTIEPDINKPVRYITIFIGTVFATPTGRFRMPVAPIAHAMVNVTSYEYVYGYNLDTNDENPETRVTYPDDVMNKGYLPAFMNYLTGQFDYGSWDLGPGEKFMPKPCMVSYTGKVAHYLDPDDYSKQEDGVTPSLVSDASYPGNAMMEWGKIYTKRWTDDDGVYHFRCSDQKLDAAYECWCNYDDNDNEIDHFYTSIYPASQHGHNGEEIYYTSKSISGQTIYLSSYSSARDSALCRVYNGTGTSVRYDGGWDITMLSDHLLLQDLLVMISKTTDTQSAFGTGIGHATANIPTTTGSMDTKGMFWGGNQYNKGVKVFGMEDLWGGNRRYVAGLAYSKATNNQYYIKITKGAKDGIGAESDSAQTKWNRRDTLKDYIATSTSSNITLAAPGGTGSYINEMHVESYGRLPKSTSAYASSSSYECDYFYAATSAHDTRLLPCTVGTYMTTGSSPTIGAGTNGAFAICTVTADSSATNSKCCAHLSFKPNMLGG